MYSTYGLFLPEEEEVSREKAGRMGKVLKFVLELIEFE